ncbi:MAG: SUMF1/EgtB/PvdO family nonheme iron enzyme, partial [Planctomycetota bacterium]
MLFCSHTYENSGGKSSRKVSRLIKCAALLAVGIIALHSSGVSGKDRKPASEYTETVTTQNGEKISFKMVPIPGGTFVMGSPENEAGHKEDEGPQHQVRVDPFYLCTTETTIELFMAYYQETVSAKRDFDIGNEAEKSPGEGIDAVTGPTPVYGDMTMGYGKQNPAMGMTWHNAMTFCKWVSLKTGREYRLPTEAEWEYASRTGTTNVFGFANTAAELKDFAWYEATADSETNEVGKKKPNAWGLYDVSGNVREWVYDFYSPTAYKEASEKTPAVNPKGPKEGKVHVARGGDYSSTQDELRCAARAFEEDWWRMGDPQIPKSRWWLPEM